MKKRFLFLAFASMLSSPDVLKHDGGENQQEEPIEETGDEQKPASEEAGAQEGNYM